MRRPNPRAWLFRVASNLWLDQLRRRRREEAAGRARRGGRLAAASSSTRRAARAFHHWNDRARTAVEVFRMDTARAGGSPEALMAASEDSRKIWAGNAVQSQGAGVKRIAHADLGMLSFETNSFVVEGAEGLTMVVFSPVAAEDRRAIEILCSRR
jgi:MmyB-like transcription regulator ligand binding domain